MKRVIKNSVIAECDSTNTLAKELAREGVEDGAWVSACQQTSGRGRLDRHWISPPGNLYLSLISRKVPRSLWSWIPLTAAVAVLKTIQGLFPAIKIQIKWPNDLWIEEKKISGILCESESTFVVIGIGINCLSSPSLFAGAQPATSLTEVLKKQIGPDLIREVLVQNLRKSLQSLGEKGPSEMIAEYSRAALFQPGTNIEWMEQDCLQIGTVLGLGDLGELKVVKEGQSQILGLFAEEVRVLRKFRP